MYAIRSYYGHLRDNSCQRNSGHAHFRNSESSGDKPGVQYQIEKKSEYQKIPVNPGFSLCIEKTVQGIDQHEKGRTPKQGIHVFQADRQIGLGCAQQPEQKRGCLNAGDTEDQGHAQAERYALNSYNFV